MNPLMSMCRRAFRAPLVLQIAIGIVAAITLAYFEPKTAQSVGMLGELFVGALKAVAPILVFMLVAAAIANQAKGAHTKMRPIIGLYLFGTLAAASVAVALSFLFPTEIALDAAADRAAPQSIVGVIHSLLFQLVDNPVHALMTGNFIGTLAWAIGLGITLSHAQDSTKQVFADIAESITLIVRFVIRLAPFGIFGLVAQTISAHGFGELRNYLQLIVVLLSAMAIVALVINPMIVFYKTRRNPYPLILVCLRESGLTAFFTRSSAANVPVNMALCKRLGLDEETYSMSIPLGATINMAGAAITITVLTLAAVHTQGIEVDIWTAILLSVVASVSACGASGVAGGSLLLIPLACGLFGIESDIAMQVVAVGMAIGVIQDSAETALNSSTDVVFTAACCQAKK